MTGLGLSQTPTSPRLRWTMTDIGKDMFNPDNVLGNPCRPQAVIAASDPSDIGSLI